MLQKQVSQNGDIILDLPWFSKEKFSESYNGVKQNREGRALYCGFFTKKEDLLVLKMDLKQLPHEIYTTVGSKEPRQK